MFKNSMSSVDDSRSTGHGRVDFSIEEEIVAGILRDRNPHQLDGIPGVWKNRPPKEACRNAPHLQLSPRSHVQVAYRTGMYCKFTKLDKLCLSSVVIKAIENSIGSLLFTFAVFELDQIIIRTNLQTKFHDDRTRNVASRVFSN
ncbi:hypothetical protein DPMN_037837 [Dreissena polymorpha]|uniref:Uncharacterized protein n=1 Tax=Dreissena polymorpha TaxID=45954 RepID=A0A9D4RQ58_DREPO|nr:hypothetical protein DPMN_037837 [Dreissena polymorpha]